MEEAQIFALISDYLESIGDTSLASYQYGGGPNWKIRIIKRALWHLGLQDTLMRHGFKREVYVCKVANNAHAYLRGEDSTPDYSNLKSIKEISVLAKNRWILPRSIRYPDFKEFKKETLLRSIGSEEWTTL